MQSPDNFVNIQFDTSTLDVYIVRTAILRALADVLPEFRSDLLDIGCGKMPYKNYILEGSAVRNYTGLDIEGALVYDENVKPDFCWDGITMPFADASFDCAMGTEVLEHCPEPEIVLKETYRILRPGGVFFFTVPFLWNLHEVPHDYYRYTPFALERLLRGSGFQEIQLRALGGWNASLAQILALWVKRKPMATNRRKMWIHLLAPIIRRLASSDVLPERFENRCMITGISGVCRK